jgi:hypothetical protein
MNDNLPVKKDNFLAEAEVMDLSKLRDKVFAVAVSTGAPDGVKFLCSTLHGPYNFTEMLQEVGDTWQQHQHHCKVIVLDKDVKNKVQFLDANTVDYIELNYADIIVEEMLGGAFSEPKDFTCQAGIVSEESSSDPRNQQKVLTAPEDEDALK